MTARGVENAPDKQALKASSAALVRAAGGMEAAAEYCRADFRRLSDYGRPNTDTFMPADVIADLERITHGLPGHPHVTRALARSAGGVFVPLCDTSEVSAHDLHAALAAAIKECSEADAALIAALADGKATPAEAEAALKDSWEAVERRVHLHCLIQRVADE